ncbi:MAG: peptide chain release factor-like protein [Candidatus Spechtbacterales bacterium]
MKEATLFFDAPYAVGFLKGEAGVHRLVRLSPFSSADLRHTSFALVDITPEIDKSINLDIAEDDLRIDLFRASGPGGQNVNKRESAVRVTHIPTGISAASQSERNQSVNKERAMSLLRSKLYMVKLKEQKETLAELKGDVLSAEWGNQIRSYVLHPYQMVKDHRTSSETSNTEAVLDGDLDIFIDSYLRQSP